MSAFPDISRITYEGPKSKNPLAFKHYNPEELVEELIENILNELI